MRKSWIRRLALVLVLCLMVNNCIKYGSVRLFAAEEESVLSVSVGDAEELALSVSTGDAEELMLSVSASDAEELADETESESGDVSGGDAGDAQDNGSDSTGWEQSDVSTGDANAMVQLQQNTTLMTANGGIALMSTPEDYYISTKEEFLAVQTGCEANNGWKGITWIIATPSEGKKWNLADLEGFTGIGTEEVPFKGTLTCAYDSGIRLELDTPLFAYLGDGAVIKNLDIVTESSSGAIADNISGSVTISDIILAGKVSGSGEAGIIAAAIEDASVVTIENVTTNGPISVSGAVAGGIAGAVGANVTISLDSKTALSAKVTGTEAAGGHFGTVTGSAAWNLADESKIVASVEANGADCYAGQFAGKLLSSDSAAGELNITGSSVAVDVSGTGNGGGLVGLIGSNANVVLPAALNITGSVNVTANAGGVAGEIDGGKSGMVLSGITVDVEVKGALAGGIVGQINKGNCEIQDITISGKVSATDTAGGIVGGIGIGKYIIGDVNIGGDKVIGSTMSGGVIGKTIAAVAVELQGNINIGDMSNGWNGGLIAGTQGGSLIYFGEPNGSDDQLKLADSTDETTFDELVRYGGIYRNQAISGGRLIGDGTLDKVGVINSTVSKNGSDYVLTSAADFEALSIALNTGGLYGTEAFSGLTAGDYKTLLEASYLVDPADGNTIDISYEKTGIATLDRNDKESVDFGFSGTMKGANALVTIHQDSAIKQQKLGVFSCIAGATIENLTITGTVERGVYVGGLAYHVMGNGVTLNNVTVQKTFKESANGTVGGVFGAQKNSAGMTITTKNLTLASVFEAPSGTVSSFIPYLDNATVNMTDTVIGGSILTTNGTAYDDTNITGGFLGMQWTQIDGTVDGLTVQSGTSYTASANFGALVTVATSKKGGRLTMKDVKLDGLAVTANGVGNSQFRSSLMVWDAKNLILEVIDYDTTGCTVNASDENFDEIAGTTKAGSGAYTISGIVSIHKTDGNGNPVFYPAYHYENQATYTNIAPKNGNNYTMYFYDVFQRLDDADGNPRKWITGTKERGILDSVEDVLLWDILHYATGGNVWETFNEYYKTYPYDKHSTSLLWDTLTLIGDLDLRKISFYPVPRIGCSLNAEPGTVITFDAAPMATWTLHNLGDNQGDRTQHYGLQGGLLYHPQEVYINGDGGELTLRGNVANFKKYSGALVVGEQGASVACSIKNVTLDGLAINNYSGQAAGLLVSKVRGNTSAASYGNVIANFDNIKMINYDSYQSSGKKVAAALIGYVGGPSVMDIRLNFRNMVIADDANGKDNHNGDVLQYASFIYEYDYTDNAQINEGYGLYLFSQSDAESGNVTYGKELDKETEFSDNDSLVYKVMFGGVDNTDTIYKPYVYQYEQIEVNPKSGNILKGCGTYEDPYIIENAKQFLTLYRFINETGTAPSNYQYKTFYNNWKIIAPGDDSEFCTTKHSVTLNADGSLPAIGAEDVSVFSEENKDFPTPEELSRAYYQLGADIDLSVEMSTTYEKIADEFVGFGTQERPFVGVWYGAGHTITLPDKPKKITSNPDSDDYKEEAYESYGFIQYAKGAVVKDMTIKSAVDGSNNFESANAVRVKSTGGGVISCIVGGDNIIDNVTVAAGFNVLNIVEDRLVYNSTTKQDETKSGITVDDMAVGGYVGMVKKGGLIIRNMPTNALTNFHTDQNSADAKYELIGAVVGKVEDGYVLYEGSNNTGSLTWTGTGGNGIYPQIPNYTILNGDGLKAASADLKVKGTAANTAETPIEITIPTAGALQVMTMALNSDALNIRPSDCPYYTTDEAGYTELSRSRKAKYSDIGCSDANTADYISAAKYDNVMNYTQGGYTNADTAYAYPYLYQYMNITEENYLNYITDYSVKISDSYVARKYSILNPTVTGKDSLIYKVWWKLAENGNYDMAEAVLGKSFRGIGATYQVGPIQDQGYGASFHGNFEGNGSTIKIELNRKLLGDDRSDGSSTSKTTDNLVSAGLFNVLYGKEDVLYLQEEDFCDIDGAANTKNCMVIQNLTITGSITADPNNNLAGKRYHLGAVAGMTNGKLNLVLDNVKVQSFTASGVGVKETGGYNVGGLIGYVGNRAYVLVRDCNVTDAILKGEQEAGGLVGKSDAYGLKITGTNVENIQVRAGGNVGGFLGWASKSETHRIIITAAADNPNTVKNSSLGSSRDGGTSTSHNTKNVGGIIGGASRAYSVAYAEVEGVTLYAYNNIGGIVGYGTEEKGYDMSSTIAHVSVKDMVANEINLYDGTLNGIGGVIGRNIHNLTIQDAQVSGSQAESFTMKPKKRRTNHTGSGGIVGVHLELTLILENCVVDTVTIATGVDSDSFINGNSVIAAAGGLVGYATVPIVLNGTQSVSNSIIKAPLSASATQDIMAAGGGFGAVVGNCTITGSTDGNYYNGFTANKNTVTGKQAGGVIGYVSSNGTNVRLTGVTVSEGSVTSDESAGGVFGYISPSWSGAALHNTATNSVKNMHISGRQAGGVIGELCLYGPFRMESILLEGNTIIAKQTTAQKTEGADYSAGGVIGSCSGSGTNANDNATKIYNVTLTSNTIVSEVAGASLNGGETDHIATGGIIGRIFEGKAINTNDIRFDNIVINATNKIGVRQAGTEAVKLVLQEANDDTTEYKLSNLTADEVAEAAAVTASKMDYEVLDKLEQDYGYYVGTMVGVIQSENMQLYILRSDDTSEKFVTPVLGTNPPVVDVGRSSGQTVDAYREYCHIIYGAENSVAQVGIPASDGADTNLRDMKAAVTAVNSAYEEADGVAILQEYRLSADAIQLFEKTYQESFTFAESMKLNFPILVWKTEYGDLQTVMEYIVDVMTNVAGISATDIDEDYLTITAKQKLYDGTTISDGAEGASSIAVETLDGETSYRYMKYDGVEDNKLTFTELTFIYGWKDHQKTFKLPVFVEEPILYNVHTKMMEGRVTDVDTIAKKGILETIDSVIMANDSDYTMLIEYSYGKARKNMPDSSYIDKVFYVTNETNNKYITKGTRLMLIDVSNDNKVYYYEVEEDTISKLTFSMFTDSLGNRYQDTSINKIPDAGTVSEDGNTHYTDLAGHELISTGVESFLLTVLAPDSAAEKNEYYNIHSGIQIEDESLKSRFYPMENETEASYTVLSIPGLSISFYKNEEGHQSDIDGGISKEDILLIDAVFELKAKDPLYWVEKNKVADGTPMIDSSNNGKYLELAFYLRDTSGNRVRFPVGTNFSYKLDTEDEFSENRVIPNDSVVYYYKDIYTAFAKEDSEYQIGNLEDDTIVDVHFKLDFSGADLSNITEERYDAWLDLLRTSNKEYPMGNGNKLDSYSEEVEANASQRLGFAIRANDLNELAINTYPKAKAEDSINYKVMFDFGEILKQSSGIGTDALVEKWAKYDYTVTYQIYRKVLKADGTTAYEKYAGDDIVLTADAAASGEGTVSGETTSGDGNMTTLYNFDANKLKNVEGFVSFPCQITMNTAELTEDLTNLTNYKLEATLVITEKGQEDSETETSEIQELVAQTAEQTKDFFIYTVTKLKTDL